MRLHPRRLLEPTLLLAVCAARASAAEPAVLRPQEPRVFEVAAGAVIELAFDLEEDRFAHLEVLQNGADVAITVLDPSGAAREADQAGEEQSLEFLSWTRSRAGRHLARIRVKTAVAGAYVEARLDEPRPSSDSDARRLACEQRYAEAAAAQQGSVPRLRQLLADFQELGDERWAARTGMYLGYALLANEATQLDEEGLELCLEAAAYGIDTADPTRDEAFVCVSAYLTPMGYLEDAIAVYRYLLAAQLADGDRFSGRALLVSLGLVEVRAGRLADAERHLTEAAAQAQASHDPVAETFARTHLGGLFSGRGDHQQALDQFERALALRNPYIHIRPLHLAAYASAQLAVGDVAGAAASARKAMDPVSRTPASMNAAALVLSAIHAERGELEQAVAVLSKGLALAREKNQVLFQADALTALGRAESARGRHAVARRHQQEALALSRTHGYRSGEVLALAALCALDDATRTDGEACRATLSLAQSVGYLPAEVVARYHLARAARRRGEHAVARALLEEVLGVLGAQRLGLRRADLRRAFSANVDDIEDEYVDLLVELADAQPAGGWEARALEASDAARGRSLRDELVESRVPIRQGVDASLLQEDEALRERLRAALARQLRGDATPAAARELEHSIAELHAGLEDMAARIRLASPRYASLSQPERPGLDAMREALLDDDSVLLYYALGERRSFLWVVTRTSLERHVLPSRKEIEPLARRAVASSSVKGGSAPALAALGRVLLAPAARRLDVSRVVIVADGALHLVPFAALPSSPAAGPLLERSEVVHLPSAATGVLLAAVPARAASSQVAVFADPVFRADDARVLGRPPALPTAKLASLPRELTRDGRLERLPFTRREAHAIQALAGDGGRIQLDFEASRQAALDERLASYRVVHFATHGLLNAARPELSGVVLSLVDRTGQPQNGFLTSLDTYNLRLDADLVVLSGCRTALGKDVRGEGVVGLTRGFMYAGARGVLATLWPVDDLATSELMRVFYEGLLGPRRLAPPAALREAQAHVRGRRAWSSPYYWAAFQLQGVWGAALETKPAATR